MAWVWDLEDSFEILRGSQAGSHSFWAWLTTSSHVFRSRHLVCFAKWFVCELTWLLHRCSIYLLTWPNLSHLLTRDCSPTWTCLLRACSSAIHLALHAPSTPFPNTFYVASGDCVARFAHLLLIIRGKKSFHSHCYCLFRKLLDLHL